MKLSAKEDIEAPVAFVNSVLSDFESWERAAMRRGADVDRLDTLRDPGPGMAWKVGFPFRGKPRQVEVKVLELVAGQRFVFQCVGLPAEGVLTIDLIELGQNRTRVVTTLDAKPKTLAARLLLQSLRLAKTKVTRRFAQRLALVSADIEDRYRASTNS